LHYFGAPCKEWRGKLFASFFLLVAIDREKLSFIRAVTYVTGLSIDHILGSDQDSPPREDFIGFRFIRPKRSMHTCNVFHFSGDAKLVSMKCRLFGSLSGILAQPQLRSIFTLAQYGSDGLGVLSPARESLPGWGAATVEADKKKALCRISLPSRLDTGKGFAIPS
jgi:hypothetical protein